MIETSGLRKEFHTRRGRRCGGEGLDLAVPPAACTASWVRGSGKTTTIRMLLGLPGPRPARCGLFGQPVPSLLPSVVNRVGAVVESPKFSPNLSGRQNLLLLAPLHRAPATRVDAWSRPWADRA